MPQKIKVIYLVLAIVLIVVASAYFIFLKPNYALEPILSGKITSETIKVNDQERTFFYYNPKRKNKHATILFVFHGSKSSGAQIRKQTAYEFDKLADIHGFIVVYPDGYKHHWNDCRASADYDANRENVDDVAFIKMIEYHISNSLSQTFKYRFATGHSNGGQFSYRLGLEAPEWINGIGPMSANLPIDSNLNCEKSEVFVPIVLINGTDDKMNLYDGGIVKIFGNTSRGITMSTNETIQYWLKLGHFSNDSNLVELPDIHPKDQSTVEKYSWGHLKKPKVVHYKIIGGGHTIPHPNAAYPLILGRTNHDLNAPKVIWDFFEDIITG